MRSFRYLFPLASKGWRLMNGELLVILECDGLRWKSIFVDNFIDT